MNNDPFIYTIMTYMVIYLGIYILYNLFSNDDNMNQSKSIENMKDDD
jgi:hypothetical protein|uniref:Uncharacterized protein n=1 Tax=viral metagenome TaxID=1070528 RepID=A0A6C0CUK1_9ZZZZ